MLLLVMSISYFICFIMFFFIRFCHSFFFFFFFFFNDTATTEIYTLSLHDALPICCGADPEYERRERGGGEAAACRERPHGDRKSTRLNSSHVSISYAVFCLKKKKKKKKKNKNKTKN